MRSCCVLAPSTSALREGSSSIAPHWSCRVTPEVADNLALDGDSIIVVNDSVDPDGVFVIRDRSLVVEVKSGRTVNGTPLVLGQRDLNDREFWDFNSVDSSYRAPTNGFVRVPEEMDFFAALTQAHWGSVIQIRPDLPIELTGTEELNISSGVTIRGQRRGLDQGALFTSEGDTDGGTHFFFTKGGFVRVTGVQLVGPSQNRPGDAPKRDRG